MRTGYTFGNLTEQWLHDLLEFGRFNDVQNLFEFVEEHHFLWTVGLRPEFQQTFNDCLCQTGIFFEELYHTVCQLWVVYRETLHFMQWQ